MICNWIDKEMFTSMGSIASSFCLLDQIKKIALIRIWNEFCHHVLLSHLSRSNEVRSLVKSAVNAGSDDEIIFCDGSYASPIERLCFLLCCNESGNGLNQSWGFGGYSTASRDLNASSGVWGSYNEQQASDSGSNSPKINNGPVVFVSTCEIPTTLQPWLDAGAQVSPLFNVWRYRIAE